MEEKKTNFKIKLSILITLSYNYIIINRHDC